MEKLLSWSQGHDFDAAANWSGLAKAALAGKINGNLLDLRTPLTESADFEIVTAKSPEARGLPPFDGSHHGRSSIETVS